MRAAAITSLSDITVWLVRACVHSVRSLPGFPHGAVGVSRDAHAVVLV